MKPYQQISLDFGFDEPAATENSIIMEKEIPLVKETSPPPTFVPVQELEPAAAPTSISAALPISAASPISTTPVASTVSPVSGASPVKIPVTDESTVLTIRRKPGRKEKEKIWKSATPGKRGRKSLKDIASEVDLIEIPDDEQLYSKQYYSIGDVANMFRMNPSLIRTWSNEFDGMLNPRKNRKGDRYFRPDDVKFLHLIYHLIRVRKFTLEGAKEHLKLQKKKTEKQFAIIQALQQFKSFLLQLKTNL